MTSNRRPWIALALGAACVGLASCSSPESKELRTQKIVLVDGEGRSRATLDTEEGTTRLRLYDTEGRRRASLAVSGDGEPGLAFFDAEGRLRLAFESLAGTPHLALNDAEERPIFEKP